MQRLCLQQSLRHHSHRSWASHVSESFVCFWCWSILPPPLGNNTMAESFPINAVPWWKTISRAPFRQKLGVSCLWKLCISSHSSYSLRCSCSPTKIIPTSLASSRIISSQGLFPLNCSAFPFLAVFFSFPILCVPSWTTPPGPKATTPQVRLNVSALPDSLEIIAPSHVVVLRQAPWAPARAKGTVTASPDIQGLSAPWVLPPLSSRSSWWWSLRSVLFSSCLGGDARSATQLWTRAYILCVYVLSQRWRMGDYKTVSQKPSQAWASLRSPPLFYWLCWTFHELWMCG